MNYILTVILFIGLLVLSVFLSNLAFKRGKNVRKIVVAQLLTFLFIPAICMFSGIISTNAANNSEPGTSQTSSESVKAANDNKGLSHIAMAVSIGLGSLGAGIAVAAAAPAAIGATSENPKIFGKSLVFVALAEGVTIFGLLISIFIYAGLNG